MNRQTVIKHVFPKTFRGKRWSKVSRATDNFGYTQLWVEFGPFTVFFQACPEYENTPSDYQFWSWRIHAFGETGVLGGRGQVSYSFDSAAKQANAALDRMARYLAPPTKRGRSKR